MPSSEIILATASVLANPAAVSLIVLGLLCGGLVAYSYRISKPKTDDSSASEAFIPEQNPAIAEALDIRSDASEAVVATMQQTGENFALSQQLMRAFPQDITASIAEKTTTTPTAKVIAYFQDNVPGASNAGLMAGILVGLVFVGYCCIE
jgi:hypothetical protein